MTPDPNQEVRYEWLRPAEADAAIDACPVLFQPLGVIEWHGVHNVVGLDSLKAHALCCAAARQAGGIVAPPLYGGVGGVEPEHTFIIDTEEESPDCLAPWLERLCHEAQRNRFKAVIMLTGHYGPGQQMIVRATAARMSRELGMPIFGTPEYFLALDETYHGDHAGWGETALMMHLLPDTVDLGRLGEPPFRGVGGRDPREASEADGRRLAETIIDRLARLAAAMPCWDAATIERFAAAEQALVDRQKSLARSEGDIWAGWRNIGHGAFDDYGRLLAAGDFEGVQALVDKL